jgi:hypothetical protein
VADFEFLKSQLRPPTTGLHDAFTGELAVAERRGEFARALNDAFKEAIERDFKGGLAQRQQDLQRELTAFEEQGRTGRAAMSEAGEERRSQRYNDLMRDQEARRREEFQTEHGDQLRKEQKLLQVQNALGALMGGPGVPQPQPPPQMMGAPMPEQGAMLDEAALMSKLDPSTALNYQAFRTQQKELEAKKGEKDEDRKLKLFDLFADKQTERNRVAQANELESRRFEHEKELQDRAARLKEPTPRDIAIGRWKDLGLKPDPGDLLNGIPPERPEAFQARMEAWIDREEARARTEKGGDSSSRPAAVTGTGTTPPPAQGGRTAVSITEQAMAEGWEADRLIKEMTEAGFDPNEDPEEQDAARGTGSAPAPASAPTAASAPAPVASAKEKADLELKAATDAANKEYADQLFRLEREGGSDRNRATLKFNHEAALKKAQKAHAKKANPKPPTDLAEYRDPSLPPEEQVKAAKAARDKAIADWEAAVK